MANEVIPLNPPQHSQQPAPQNYTVRTASILANPEQVKVNMRAAELFAQSDLVPQHYRNKPANCFIAINRAQRLGVDELYFFEKTFIVKGKLGMAAELAIELANSSGRFRGPIKFRLFGEGDARGCTAFATLAADNEIVENTVTYAMAAAEGWTSNTKWNTMRDQMLQYRAGAFLVRLYAGGSLGGMYMREELEDVAAQKPSGGDTGTRTPSLPKPAKPDEETETPQADEPDEIDIEAFEADAKAKLEVVSTLDGLDGLWKSGINAKVREIGATDKAAQNRLIAAFSRKKNAILKAEEKADEVAEAITVLEGTKPPQDEPEPSPGADDQPEPEQAPEQPAQPYTPPPPPSAIDVPKNDDDTPAWNRFAKLALEQLKQAGEGEYGTDWVHAWMTANGTNLTGLRQVNADWEAKVIDRMNKVMTYFEGREEAARREALENFPTIEVQYNDDTPDWNAFESSVIRYIRQTPNHWVAREWWKRHAIIIKNLRNAGAINDKGLTGALLAERLEADFLKFFPQLSSQFAK